MGFRSWVKDLFTDTGGGEPRLSFSTISVFGESSGSDPDQAHTEAAARLLGHAVRFVDDEGYQTEIFAAAVNEQSGAVAFFESRAKQLKKKVDVTIALHIKRRDGREVRWEIVTYNPYFGCDVRFMEWIGETILAIYREKHRTYVCRVGVDFPALCKEIGDYWIINGSVLASRRSLTDTVVRRLSLPEISELPDISQADAESAVIFPATASLLPTKFWQEREARRAK